MTYEQCRSTDNYLLYKPCSVKKTQPGYEDIGIADPAHNVLIPMNETLPAESHSLYGITLLNLVNPVIYALPNLFL